MMLRKKARWDRYVRSAAERRPDGQDAIRTGVPEGDRGGGARPIPRKTQRTKALLSIVGRFRAGRSELIEPRLSPARDLRLLPAALAAWVTAAVAIRLEATDALWLGIILAFLALVSLAVIVLCRKDPPALRVLMVSTGIAAMVCFPAAARMEQQQSSPAAQAVAAAAHVTVKLQATSDAGKASSTGMDGSVRWILEAQLLEGTFDGNVFSASTPIVLLGGEDWRSVAHGDVVQAAGKLTPTDAGERAQGLLIASTAPDTIARASDSGAPVEVIRERFLTVASETGIPDGGLMAGMVIGARSAVDEGLVARMRATGLTHLTAVSGANCTYVLAFVFLACRACRLPRWAAAAAGVLALIAFVLLVRPEPSVLRAAVMGSIGVLAVLSGRGRLSMTLLFLSIAALLTADPWLSGEYAFVLSVAATSGLVLVGPLLAARLGALLPAWLAQLIAVPLAAQLFCSPVLVLIQPSMPTYSLPANILAAPAVPFITIVGMMAVVGVALLPWVALPFAAAAAWGATWVAGIAGFFASAPLAAIPWPGGAGGAALTAVASLSLIALAVWWRQVSASIAFAARMVFAGQPRGGFRKSLVWVGVGCVLGGIGIWAWTSGPVQRPPEWTLAGCDVGQGDGFVVRTGDRSAMVFDAGPDPALIDRCLDDLNVDTVELLILTHLHQDHYGGIAGVFSDRAVKRLVYSTSEDALPREVSEAASAAGVVPELLKAGAAGTLGSVSWTALWPRTEEAAASENDASAVELVTIRGAVGGGTLEALFTGDLEEEAAEEVLSANPQLASTGVDILKVAHHGARNGGDQMIELLSPPIALISVGEKNEYGHPHPAILDSLTSVGAHAVRTDQQGTFVLVLEGTSVRIRSLP